MVVQAVLTQRLTTVTVLALEPLLTFKPTLIGVGTLKLDFGRILHRLALLVMARGVIVAALIANQLVTTSQPRLARALTFAASDFFLLHPREAHITHMRAGRAFLQLAFAAF